ncbi:MAG: YdcF family protein [Lachnospiraceae bacterium]|jgi:uncharacterized SAM-binding protein YcdF (DUF218 family)|nr:YdcF family protein [Lachnospiraceae bacterium]MDD3616053.1 YdcF family protein [Lachnospiraceae bacterium]
MQKNKKERMKKIRSRTDQIQIDLDYLIILGADVRGYMPCEALRWRLDTAVDYLRRHEQTNVVVSGGQGADEEITEASCMANYLMHMGIAKERIWMEERATSTWENISFSYALLEEPRDTYRIGIVTNGFHIPRSLAVAKKIGTYEVYGIAAPMDDTMKKIIYSIREIFALLSYKLQGKI